MLSQKLGHKNRKLLSLFVTAGYPDIETTVPLALALSNAGADIIELGIPFSDPIADGPTIQHSSEIALRNGMTLKKTFEIAEEIRRQSDIPLILMGYSNPVYAFGIEPFISRCKSVGVDGTIIADIPLEESNEYRSLAQHYDISTIFLAAPTTPSERLAELDKASTGFLYCLSVTGVTGERTAVASQAEEFLQRARTRVKHNPLLVGFGISSPDDARRLAQYADGVIIGSALLNILEHPNDHHAIEHAAHFVQSMRNALDNK